MFATVIGIALAWSSRGAAQPVPPPETSPPPPETSPPPKDPTAPPKIVEPPPSASPSPEPSPQQQEAPRLPPEGLPRPPEAPPPPPSGFFFSSYGRMIAATDWRGRPGRDADLVAHGSRLDESPYVELTLRRDDHWKKTDSTTRLVATLAVANPIFHYNADFDIKLAIRNLYLEESDLGLRGLSVWAGSRMYRGDDIYLLDFWPLDNLNTVGAGARMQMSKATATALHGGLSLPKSIFYLQDSQRPSVFNQFGATTVNILERQRFIGSAKVSHEMPLARGIRLKGALYSEFHRVPSGQRETMLPRVFETLPGEGGFVIGAQVGAFTGSRNDHVNLFLRYATGLAAYGEFAAPEGGTSSGAHEFLLAASASWETGPLGLLAGAYVRSFRNATKDLDASDVDEGILVIRPHLFLGEIGGIAIEGSYQVMQRGVVTVVDADNKPTDALGPLTAGLFRIGLIPFLSPAGKGALSRPQFRLIYLLTARGENARRLYPLDDVYSLRGLEHFFGLGAEWWFNETTYGG
jgi:hypothetical protein